MVIIIDGTDSVGKTEVVSHLARKMPLCNVVKLCGAPAYVEDRGYMRHVYDVVFDFIRVSSLNNVIFDRFTTSERLYSSLFRGYDTEWIDEYEERLAKLEDVTQIILVASREDLARRLDAKTTRHHNERQPDIDTLLKIQDAYIRVVSERKTKYPSVIVQTDGLAPDEVANRVLALLERRER